MNLKILIQVRASGGVDVRLVVLTFGFTCFARLANQMRYDVAECGRFPQFLVPDVVKTRWYSSWRWSFRNHLQLARSTIVFQT